MQAPEIGWKSEFHSGSAGPDNEALSSRKRRVARDVVQMAQLAEQPTDVGFQLFG